MSFEELGDILDRNNLFQSFCNSDRVKLALLFAEVFKMGEKSQQSKIDELQKRIDELERGCRSYKNQRDDYAEKLTIKTIHYNSIVVELGELKDRVQSAYHVATQSTWSSLKQLRKVVNILKGEK